MQIRIRLLSGDILTFTPKGVRGNRCKIATHAPHIRQMVMTHLQLSSDTHFITLVSEDDVKEMDHVYYGFSVYPKSEYYQDGEEITAFAESFEEQKENYFASCTELLTKATQLYESIGIHTRALTENQIYDDEEYTYMKYSDIYDVKHELELAIWTMSHDLGIPIILTGCDPQKNTTRIMASNHPTKTILYYTRSIASCEEFINKSKEHIESCEEFLKNLKSK